MMKKFLLLIFFALLGLSASAQNIKVIDAPSGEPLPLAPVFDKNGNYILTADNDGIFEAPQPDAFPLTIRYMGYENASVGLGTQTIPMQPTAYELKEAVITPQERNIIRPLCYVRAFINADMGQKNLTTFSEAMGDYFFPEGKVKGFKPQLRMRVLNKKSYGRFSDAEVGLDSLFAMKDSLNSLLGMVDVPSDGMNVPAEIRSCTEGSKTVTSGGKSAAKETWIKAGNKLLYKLDLLAGKKKHSMSPFLLKVLGYTMDIHEAVMSCSFDGYNGEKSRSLRDISSFSVTLNVTARGKAILKRLRSKDPVELKVYYEIYVVDRSHLTLNEANDLISNPPKRQSVSLTCPKGIPGLDSATLKLIEGVKALKN